MLGMATLSDLVRLADGRIEILAGSGVIPAAIPLLAEKAGVRAFHLSGKERRTSQMIFRRENVPMGLPGFDEYELWQTNEEVIRSARQALDRI